MLLPISTLLLIFLFSRPKRGRKNLRQTLVTSYTCVSLVKVLPKLSGLEKRSWEGGHFSKVHTLEIRENLDRDSWQPPDRKKKEHPTISRDARDLLRF